jgi:hypothetical protein
MIDDLLAFGGIGAHPTLPSELAARRPLLERRVALLAAHLAHVEASAPADAEPHRWALARAEDELRWLGVREAEEDRYAASRKANPPGLGRDIRETIAILLGRPLGY